MSGLDTAKFNSELSISKIQNALREKGLNPVKCGSVLTIGNSIALKIHSQHVSGTADQKLLWWL